jgi:eukaryotic-like serine/threonine-protein kinase
MDAPVTATERQPLPSPSTPRPARLGLGLRIFLLVSLLILLAVASSVAFTWFLADRIAREEISQHLETEAAIREAADFDRYDRFQLLASLFVADANLQAYIAESVAQDQTASLLDLLLERQEELGFDFAILLDPSGVVLARTDRLDDGGVDLSSRPLVAEALESYQAAGVWSEGGRLYHAVAIPVAQGFDLLGFFVAAFRIDDAAAREARRITGSEAALFGLSDDGFRVIGSTFEPAPTALLAAALDARRAIYVTVAGGSEVFPVEVRLSGKPWIAHVAPLTDATGQPVGAAVALASLDEELAPYRRIEWVLILSGLGAVFVAFLLTYAMAGRILRPIRRLVAAANAARGGDYDQRIAVERHDEVGQLGLALDHLLSDLREKRDMETYVAELSRNLPAAAGAGETEPVPAEIAEMTLLAVEFRRHAAADTGPSANAARALADLDTDVRRAREEVGRRGGRVLGLSGHRVLAGFERAEHTRAALATASQLLLAAAGSPHPPVLAVAAGSAAVRLQGIDDGWARAVGRPLQILESLMREGSSGEILIADRVFEEIGPSLAASGIVLAERRGLVTPIRFFALDAAAARQMASDQEITGELSPVLTPLSPGAVVAGRFEVLSRLGAGGMGVVYKARDRELEDVVALKILRLGRFEGPEKTEALKQELKLARRITHPNVLRVFDLGQIEGVPFVSMEYVRGLTMRDLLDHATEVPYSAALRIGRQVCQGLAAVHAAGIIHRDMKPENILLDPSGNVRLMDFGIAQRLGQSESDGGMVRGTPRYLAPEQILGQDFDTRADIFACGVLFFELFTGRLPFPDSRNPAEVIQATLDLNPPAPSTYRPDIPARLDEILLRCLRKAPSERYRDASELLAAFEGLTP